MIAVVFPGQGSQSPGMGRDLWENFDAARAVFDEVSDTLGSDISRLCFESDADTLRQTQNAQIALYTCGLAAYRTVQPSLPSEHVLAGHSIGEYAAVVASGALNLEDGARLVMRRGELMAGAGTNRQGTMAAVLGLDRESLEIVCKTASTESEVVVIANDNCPGQLVISGDVAAVSRAGELASTQGAKRVLPLNVSGAFHSPLMHESAQLMGEALRAAPWHRQNLRVIANVTADVCEHGREWAELLERQLESPVRWTETVQCMAKLGVTTVIECGVGEVLSGLVKRTEPGISQLKVNDSASHLATQDALASSFSAPAS